ncbi:glycosyltransferase family protein [Azoarcus sp. KH32C]|nr:glycosyltransferase [Azoarcus sp. KH32C]BAL26043.1 glycosyltransferase family protein [Azoarcus sp. KH32C]
MVARLLTQVLTCPAVSQVLVTLNVPESLRLPEDERVSMIENARPEGFGANHNAAFARCSQPYFCPLNPDIELEDDPFPSLIAAIEEASAAVAAPAVKSPDGDEEDSIRFFPTLRSLALKALGGADGRYLVQKGQGAFFPEWVAGMFMLFRSADYAHLKGFDEGFFLYYEDVDICVRAWQSGLKVLACPSVSVIHDARRDSRRSLRHLGWHLASMARYFLKHRGRLPNITDCVRDHV